MLSSIPQPILLKKLLWRHFTWHLWVGLAIWTCLVASGSLYHYVEQRSFILHTDFYTHNQPATLSLLASNTAWLAVMLLFGGFIPAAVAGLARQPFLVTLSRRAHSPRELIWKSLLLFELVVCALAIIPWPIAYNKFGLESFGRQLRALFVFSLPWFLSTGLASWRLGTALFPAFMQRKRV